MTTDKNQMRDAFTVALGMAREMADSARIIGWGVAELRGPDGRIKQLVPFANKITTFGDEYYAKRGGAGVSPATPADMTKVDGMKVGRGSTAAAKSGAGAALVTYTTSISANQPFDATYPQFTDETGDTGWSIVYKTTFAAGEATDATGLQEAVICNDATVDEASTAGETISRVVFASAIVKGASDTLAITWNHTFNAS